MNDEGTVRRTTKRLHCRFGAASRSWYYIHFLHTSTSRSFWGMRIKLKSTDRRSPARGLIMMMISKSWRRQSGYLGIQMGTSTSHFLIFQTLAPLGCALLLEVGRGLVPMHSLPSPAWGPRRYLNLLTITNTYPLSLSA